jgi:gas vesicle protein
VENYLKEIVMRRLFGFLIGIFIGALIGSTVTLLLAPDTGEKLRTQLRARGEDFLAEIREAAEKRRVELTDRLDTLRAPRTTQGPTA